MRKFLRTTLALTVAGILFFPATTGTTHAQSSFISGSSSAGAETNTPTPKDPKATHLENLLKELMAQGGMTVTDEAEAIAKTYLERAMNNELPVFEGTDYDESDGPTDVSVSIFPLEEIDFEIAQIEARLSSSTNVPDEEIAQFAALVDTEGDNYYAVMVFIFY